MISSLMSGIIPFTDEDKKGIKDFVLRILNKGTIDVYDTESICDIIKICNIIYNNAPNELSPLDDDLYDRLIVLCKNQSISYPIGAPPVQFKSNNNSLDLGGTYSGPKTVIEFVPNYQDMHYFKDLTHNQYPIYGDFIRSEPVDGKELVRQRIAPHNYDMCGTLDKCKFVLTKDSPNISDPTISIFERDFLGKHISRGIIDQNNITLLASLKYDGISVEATIKGDKLVSACTRGDIESNQATDLTPVLEGMVFPRATGKVDPNETFGIKFEFIINTRNLAIAASEYQLNYVNPRNAVIGLLGRLDSYKFRDLLIPVPLESSITINPQNLDHRIYPRLLELDFLNSYYTRGIDMRYSVISGTYVEVLYKLKTLVEEADTLRAYSEFQYDGIVVEYLDPSIRATLGKSRSIPNYAIAIKFPPMKRTSVFTHYTYSVGQTGVIVPKAHFLPVEFMGQMHDKTTVHSLKRFRELGLRVGDSVDLTLNNDVIVYLVKSQIQPENKNPPEQFPLVCPSCGSKLVLSESGDSAMCPNFMCQERCIQRLSGMLAKLNIKNIATETIRALNVHTLSELLSINKEYAQRILGDVKGNNTYYIINNDLLGSVYTDYQLVGSIGFTGIAARTWKQILSKIKIRDLLDMSDQELDCLLSIPGIGIKTVETIKIERKYFRPELEWIWSMYEHNQVKVSSTTSGKEIRFSGVRDQNLANQLESHGYEVSMESGITEKTEILIVPYRGYDSNTVRKAMKILNKRLKTAGQIFEVNDYQGILQANSLGLRPIVYPLDELVQNINLLE